MNLVNAEPPQSAPDARTLPSKRRLLAAGISVGLLAALVIGVTVRNGPASTSSTTPTTTAWRPESDASKRLAATVTRYDGSQPVIAVVLAPPAAAVEMAVTDDATFESVPWVPAATDAEIQVSSRGYLEIFARFRDGNQQLVGRAIGGVSVPGTEFTDAGVVGISGGNSPARVSSIGAVSPTVLAVTVSVSEKAYVPVGGSTGPGAFDVRRLDMAGEITLTSPRDPNFSAAQPAVAVVRRTVPTGLTALAGDNRFSVEHALFVTLNRSLLEGSHYVISLPGVASQEFTYDTQVLRSPAVQVDQVGFMPSDPAKIAFLSASLAGQHPVDYSDRSHFSVFDITSGVAVFSGQPVRRPTPAEGEYARGDLTGAPVWELDFTPVATPGRYRVCVAGVGCSYPFSVSDTGTWLKAAATVARAAFDQRSGVALGPPFTSVVRTRIQHPDDGRTVFASAQSLLDNGQGSNDTFQTLVKKSTRTTLPDGWGGHMDAGDWDRRIQHLWYLRAGLDLVDLYPKTFATLDLNIPESGDRVPDVIDEGLWSLDFYLRLQQSDGGVRGGIEASAAPPKDGTSWSSKQKLLAYAPDPWSSFIFAGVAAEASHALRAIDPDRSSRYLAAAVRAADWALAHKGPNDHAEEIEGQRLVAAAALYRATGLARWQAEFLRANPLATSPVDALECHRHQLCDAAWIFLRTDRPDRNVAAADNARASFGRTADSVVAGAETSAYGFPLDDARVPMVWGLGPSIPKTTVLIRAFTLFGDQRYWSAAVRAGAFSLGANPLNTSFVTGLGQANPKHPLVVDQQNGGLPVWPGLPVYGVHKADHVSAGEAWFPKYFLTPAGTTPTMADTPLLWSWYDLPVFAAQNEYTLFQSHAGALFAFGSLAALAAVTT